MRIRSIAVKEGEDLTEEVEYLLRGRIIDAEADGASGLVYLVVVEDMTYEAYMDRF